LSLGFIEGGRLDLGGISFGNKSFTLERWTVLRTSDCYLQKTKPNNLYDRSL